MPILPPTGPRSSA
ncbi:hypothetical protein BN1723_015239 [Verticillium longisporum]|uniref:Uncharacterized protein n=1 Tax=Verticillium longisporum TaxID=100787 RepID=A0A0G4MUF3_VERLO|nr:hypothetical protein BN1723_015239 [Verticillium longisporum]